MDNTRSLSGGRTKGKVRNALNGNLSDEVRTRERSQEQFGRENVTVAGLIAVAKGMVCLAGIGRCDDPRSLAWPASWIEIAAVQVLPFLDLSDPEVASADSVIA